MLLNFQKQFVGKILRKEKRHTIRAKRKRRPRVGEICHNYTGLRQKGARLLGRWPCVKVQDVLIYECGDGTLSVWIDGIELEFSERDQFARSDGFEDFTDLTAFWMKKHRKKKAPLVFKGDMIHWDPTIRAKWPAKSSASKAKRPPEGVKRK